MHEPSKAARVPVMLPSLLRNEMLSVDSLYSFLVSTSCGLLSGVWAGTGATSSVAFVNASRPSVFLPEVLLVACGLRFERKES